MKKQNTYRTEGQSLLEMTFILPLLLILLFAIIDLGYYVYGYASIYQAVRQGSDVAAYYPPYPSRLRNGPEYLGRDPDTDELQFGTVEHADWYDMRDICTRAIVVSTQRGAVLMDLRAIEQDRDKFMITYHETPDGPPLDISGMDTSPRELGKSVQVAITHTIEPLTPLWGLIPIIGNEGRVTVKARSMRTIQGQGESVPLVDVPGWDPDQTVVCTEDPD